MFRRWPLNHGKYEYNVLLGSNINDKMAVVMSNLNHCCEFTEPKSLAPRKQSTLIACFFAVSDSKSRILREAPVRYLLNCAFTWITRKAVRHMTNNYSIAISFSPGAISNEKQVLDRDLQRDNSCGQQLPKPRKVISICIDRSIQMQLQLEYASSSRFNPFSWTFPSPQVSTPGHWVTYFHLHAIAV